MSALFFLCHPERSAAGAQPKDLSAGGSRGRQRIWRCSFTGEIDVPPAAEGPSAARLRRFAQDDRKKKNAPSFHTEHWGKSAAFTLLELLIVLAVVGVLSALAYPAYQHMVGHSRAAACLSNLRQIGGALNLYLGEHNMILPTLQAGRHSKTEEAPAIDNTLNAYTQDARIFACPGDAGGLAASTGTSYFWNSALNGQAVAALNFFKSDTPSRIPVLLDKQSFHPYEPTKVNFLYADGHATKDPQSIFSTGK